MIIDALSNCSSYANAHPRFQKAFAFLISQPLATLPCGRYDIDEHWRVSLDGELKITGMFHLNATFYAAYLRAGFSYRF